MEKSSQHGMWSSHLAFVLAATGAAVGLGNIWRFPYLASDNGGGAFVLIYLGCVVAIGLPLLLTEIALGRAGRRSPINSFVALASSARGGRLWQAIGWLGFIAAIFILSFYSVVAGWTLHYAWLYLGQVFGGPGIVDPVASFAALRSDPGSLLFWHSVFMAITIGVVAFGVERGLERAVSILMPTLLLLLLVLVGYGISTGYFGQAVEFLFRPDFSRISTSTVVSALGQAFFSLSLGMCGIMAYGAYLPANVPIGRVGLTVALADTGVALLAGLAIFPVVFAFGLQADGGGPGLIFNVLPLAFAEMRFGALYGLAFFLLLMVAAWTSSISMLEPPTAYLTERTRFGRARVTIGIGLVIWAFGLLTVFSGSLLAGVRLFGRDVEGAIQFIASDLMLPIGGLLLALYAGWALDRRISREQLADLPDWAYLAWRWLLRVVTPVLVVVVMVAAAH